MTLDEAIKHCKEKANELRLEPFKEKLDIMETAECETCAEEHEQLAEWLIELKHWQELKLVCAFDGYVIYKEKDNE